MWWEGARGADEQQNNEERTSQGCLSFSNLAREPHQYACSQVHSNPTFATLVALANLANDSVNLLASSVASLRADSLSLPPGICDLRSRSNRQRSARGHLS